MTCVFTKGEDTQGTWPCEGRGGVSAMHPQAKGHQGFGATPRHQEEKREHPAPELSEGVGPTNTLISVF